MALLLDPSLSRLDPFVEAPRLLTHMASLSHHICFQRPPVPLTNPERRKQGPALVGELTCGPAPRPNEAGHVMSVPTTAIDRWHQRFQPTQLMPVHQLPRATDAFPLPPSNRSSMSAWTGINGRTDATSAAAPYASVAPRDEERHFTCGVNTPESTASKFLVLVERVGHTPSEHHVLAGRENPHLETTSRAPSGVARTTPVT